MSSLDKHLAEKISKLQTDNLLRTLKTTEREDDAIVIRAGKKLLSFSCNDYLGMSQNRNVIKAARAAAAKYGTSAGASRLITGNNPFYDKLEAKLAEICGTESALVFSSGYMANVGAIAALMQPRDLIITDKLSHSCIIEGAILSGAEIKRFAHNSMEGLETILSKYRSNYNNCLVITESVFSMDGDSPDMDKINQLAEKYNSWVMVDYAHDLNHLISIDHRPSTINIIKMGTLSKAVGSYGGYIAGSKTLIDYLKTSARTLVFTTGLPPATLAASLKSLEIIQKENKRVKKALENASYFRKIISENLKELEIGSSNSQIVPLVIGGVEDTLKLSEFLQQKGYLVHAIRPPTVPVNTSRLRFSFSAEHERSQVDKLCKVLIKYFKKPH
jgi:8-amino-7-oxononanoate synthase